jgi:hypothetical protein
MATKSTLGAIDRKLIAVKKKIKAEKTTVAVKKRLTQKISALKKAERSLAGMRSKRTNRRKK